MHLGQLGRVAMRDETSASKVCPQPRQLYSNNGMFSSERIGVLMSQLSTALLEHFTGPEEDFPLLDSEAILTVF